MESIVQQLWEADGKTELEPVQYKLAGKQPVSSGAVYNWPGNSLLAAGSINCQKNGCQQQCKMRQNNRGCEVTDRLSEQRRIV